MYTFECLLKFGHMGSGQALEKAVRLRADSIIEAMRLAQRLPGVKKGRSNAGGAQVLRVAMVQ